MDSVYLESYRQLYRRHWWWRSRETFLVRVVRSLLGDRPNSEILDVGCGAGLFFEHLSEFGEVFGVEVDAESRNAAGAWNARISAGPFDRSFRSGRRYDLILMADVLEHLDEPEEALRVALGLLKPGGRVLVTVPALPSLWTRHDVLNDHRRRYTRDSMWALVTSAGGWLEDSRYFFAWLVPAKLATRFLERLRPSPVAPRVPIAPLNWLLTGWSVAEHRLAARMRFPFGSSLLAIVRPAAT